MKFFTRKNIRLIILTILGTACFIILNYTGRNPSRFFLINSFRLPNSTISGVLSGTMSLVCFLLIFTDYKKGFKIGLAINIISVLYLIFGMIKQHSIVSLPGLFTHIVSFITLITIYSFYSRLSVSNMTDYITTRGNRRNYVK